MLLVTRNTVSASKDEQQTGDVWVMMKVRGLRPQTLPVGIQTLCSQHSPTPWSAGRGGWQLIFPAAPLCYLNFFLSFFLLPQARIPTQGEAFLMLSVTVLWRSGPARPGIPVPSPLLPSTTEMAPYPGVLLPFPPARPTSALVHVCSGTAIQLPASVTVHPGCSDHPPRVRSWCSGWQGCSFPPEIPHFQPDCPSETQACLYRPTCCPLMPVTRQRQDAPSAPQRGLTRFPSTSTLLRGLEPADPDP